MDWVGCVSIVHVMCSVVVSLDRANRGEARTQML